MTTDLCDFCVQQICASGQAHGIGQDSLAALEKSALARCMLCSSLLCDLREQNLIDEELEWPLYRWNMRQSASIREAKTMFAVTFRPMVPLETNHKSTKLQALPERSFHFHKAQDLGTIPTLNDLGSRTDSTESWDRIRKWFDTCHNHARCKPRNNNRFTPTRLVDISAVRPWDNVFGHVFIVETGPNNITKPYVTLSHAWGPRTADNHHPFLSTVPENYERLCDPERGIKWNGSELSKNFKEAILVARQLMTTPEERVKYIWIDSLCIIQGSDGDFKTEKNYMHEVYRQSLCNIAVADSIDSTGGLFRPRQSPKQGVTRPLVPATLRLNSDHHVFGRDTWRAVSQDLWDSQVLNSMLYQRAWVFQERMLAPRLLHFCANQVFWDCATISACEILPDGLPGAMDNLAATDRHWRERLQDGFSLKHRPLAGTADVSVEKFWKSAVRNYTSCDLTNGNDKFDAIWGVAKLVRDTRSDDYGLGMWADKLADQLAWSVVECRQANGQRSVRPDRPWAPSWSWVSVDGIVELHDTFDDPDYRVTDHEGENIAFQVDGRVRTRRPTRKSSLYDNDYHEDFGMWLKGIEEIQELRSIGDDNLVHSPTASKMASVTDQKEIVEANKQKENEPLKLSRTGLKIMGHIRNGVVSKSDTSSIWTLRAANGTSDPTVLEAGRVEVFPDEPPPENTFDCQFVVLAYKIDVHPTHADSATSRISKGRRHDSVFEDQEVRTYDEDDDDDKRATGGSALVQSPEEKDTCFGNSDIISNPRESSSVMGQLPVTYSGSGIILKCENEAGNRYSRIGAFNFHDIDKVRTKTLVAVYDESSRTFSQKCRRAQAHKFVLI